MQAAEKAKIVVHEGSSNRTEAYQRLLQKAKTPITELGFKLTVCEDNEARIKIALKKRSQALRHIRRTHRVNLDWLYEAFDKDEINLRYVRTNQQIADVLTKHFSNRDAWRDLLSLLGLRRSGQKNSSALPEVAKEKISTGEGKTKKNADDAHGLGGPRQAKQKTSYYPSVAVSGLALCACHVVANRDQRDARKHRRRPRSANIMGPGGPWRRQAIVFPSAITCC